MKTYAVRSDENLNEVNLKIEFTADELEAVEEHWGKDFSALERWTMSAFEVGADGFFVSLARE